MDLILPVAVGIGGGFVATFALVAWFDSTGFTDFVVDLCEVGCDLYEVL